MKTTNIVTHRGELDVNGLKIPCYILENGERVLSTTEMQRALGVIGNEPGQRSSKRLDEILTSKAVMHSISKENDASKYAPLLCYDGKRRISAFRATALPEICDLMLKTRDYANQFGIELGKRQQAVIIQADIIIRSLAKVGIIALVDEATGYQYVRERDELQKILKAYISEELLIWQKTFPDVFYTEIFRLNGWDYTMHNIKKRPGVVGTWTNKLIYEQLPKGVLEELKNNTPKSAAGNYTARFFQSLTQDIGNPHLQAQINSVIPLMQISDSWKEFISNFNKMVDRRRGQLELKFEDFQPKPETSKIKPVTDFDKSLKGLLSVTPEND